MNGVSALGPDGPTTSPAPPYAVLITRSRGRPWTQPGFELIVETGLGAGPQAFRSFSMHTFPASRPTTEIWTRQVALPADNFEEQPAYQALKDAGMDPCGDIYAPEVRRISRRTEGIGRPLK